MALICFCLIANVQFLVSHEISKPTYGLKNFRGKTIEDRVYLHPGMAQVTPKGLTVQINGELLLVPTIESDEYGVFVRNQYIAGRVKPGDWCCTTCWNWNPGHRVSCSWCGADRED